MTLQYVSCEIFEKLSNDVIPEFIKNCQSSNKDCVKISIWCMGIIAKRIPSNIYNNYKENLL